MKTQQEMMVLISKRFPNIWIKPGEAFSPQMNGEIWTGSEGETFVDKHRKVPAFNPHRSIFYNK